MAKRKAVYPPAYFFRVRTRDLLLQKYASANWSKPAFNGLPTSLSIRLINLNRRSPPHLHPPRTAAQLHNCTTAQLHNCTTAQTPVPFTVPPYNPTHLNSGGSAPKPPVLAGRAQTVSTPAHHGNPLNLSHALPRLNSPPPHAPPVGPASPVCCSFLSFLGFHKWLPTLYSQNRQYSVPYVALGLCRFLNLVY